MTEHATPDQMMQTGMGFMASKTLLSAVELELFTVLGDRSMMAREIGDRLGLHPRSLEDFLDALVALGLLRRDGDGLDAEYRNTVDTAFFLDKARPAYLGGILEMANARRSNAFGLLMSLNMLIELPGGFDYTGARFDGWAKGAGFARTEVVALAGPTSAAIAYKD